MTEAPCANCESKTGRNRDLCECRGYNGRPHPRLHHCNHWRSRWGLQPLTEAEVQAVRATLPVTVPQPCKTCGRKRRRRTVADGPGSELIRFYQAKGMPTCGACEDLATQMNAWGIRGCKDHLADIVADILPRARQWMADNASWIHAWLPSVLEDAALTLKIRSDVLAAIEKFKNRTANKNGNRHVRRRLSDVPLVGVPIDRSKVVSHIIYHVMPLSGETEWVWRRHCERLRAIRHEFNGRLIVGVVTPGYGDHWHYCPVDAVREVFDGVDAEFVTAPNHVARHGRGGRGEGVLFPQMLSMLETDDPNQVAFYGHCKGVTRVAKPTDPPHLWADAMWETLFCNQSSAITALDTHGVCGPLRMRGKHPVGKPGVGPFWFFSGTFFAMRLADVFSRDWRYLPTHYGCVEQWPRLNFALDTESACLFFDGVNNLYDATYWETTITPALQEWRLNHGTYRATGVLSEAGETVPALVPE